MTVNRWASLLCTVLQVVELSPIPWISSIPGPDPATRNARRYPWIVRNSKEGVSSRTERRLGFRVNFANFVVGPLRAASCCRRLLESRLGSLL